MARSIRLTKGMLKSMSVAINELLSGEGPQGFHEDGPESAEIMRNARRAQDWIIQEEYRRGNEFKLHQERRKAYDRGGY